ncbi:hypothetical protein [Dyadobacter helix]|uniref:hypothetical protein n=1 Tax=Dyadobacter helix TaxID=2822344 RepID=UPI001BFC5A14|nr:hypothetical protein [Dyadobacter sp. CECT 9275]
MPRNQVVNFSEIPNHQGGEERKITFTKILTDEDFQHQAGIRAEVQKEVHDEFIQHALATEYGAVIQVSFHVIIV